MGRFKKFIIWFFVILVVLIIGLFVTASVYVKKFKPDLEDALTKNIGLITKIDGPLALKVMPGISFVANDMKIISNETYPFQIKKIEIAIDVMSLFSSEFQVKALHFTEPQVYLFRDKDGVYNYETAYAGLPGMSSTENKIIVALEEMTVTNGRILFYDWANGDTLIAEGINLRSEDINYTGSVDHFDASKLNFNGKVELNSLKLNMLLVDSLNLKVDSRGGKISIQPKDKTYFQGKSSGKAIIDLTRKPAFVHVQHQLTGMDVGEFQAAVKAEELLFGKLNTSIDISFESLNWNEAIQTMKGEIAVGGTGLLMQGVDIDQMLEVFESTQQFNASDLGAVFIAGPYGAVFATGINYAAILNKPVGNTTEIRKFVSNWSIDKGIATATDVAFSTSKYRMALTGNLNFTNNTYNKMVIALIDKKGCAALSEEMNGSLMEPEKQSISNLGNLKATAADLGIKLGQTSNKTCQPVYTGSVEHPEVN